MFQVCLYFYNKVEGLESALQLVTVYVGPFTIAQLAPRFKLHVVYDEAMSTWAGVHFIALTHTRTQKTESAEGDLTTAIYSYSSLGPSLGYKVNDK